jgi:murein DD-endopeptidase MepM/ murein hydrolase activator NlpD
MNQRIFSRCSKIIILIIPLTALLFVKIQVNAAYRIARPIAIDNGYITQDYLYGVGDSIHKGIDIAANLDTNVYAVADGVVRQIEKGYKDYCGPLRVPPDYCPAFGNFILIRHTKRHFDITTHQLAYVYSLYAHLSQNDVFVNVNDNIHAGNLIGRVDSSGNSTGNHLHLQIMIDTAIDRTISYPLSWSESSTRNPELWLKPYNESTGIVVGKVTNTNGDTVGGLQVSGLSKPYLGGIPYSYNLTYNNTNLKPDDILMENWATTDVTPGYYQITLNNGSDMGWHTVEAGQVTYVGLYPVWLPNLYGAYNNWTSQIAAVNASSVYTAQVYLTFFNIDGSVNSQYRYKISPKARSVFTIPMSNFYISASLVSSEELSVMVFNYHPTLTELNSYTGVTPKNGVGPSGWEIADNILYAPSIKRNYYGRSSTINVFNSGLASTTVHVDYYDNGLARNGGDYVVGPYAWATIIPSGFGAGGCGSDMTICSAVITANPPQPLAGAVIQNIGYAATDIYMTFYNPDGSQNPYQIYFINVQPKLSIVSPEFTPLGNNLVGNARATASQPLQA